MHRRTINLIAIWSLAFFVALLLDAPLAAWVHASGLWKQVQGTRWAEILKLPGQFWFNLACCCLLLVLGKIRFKQAVFVVLCGIVSGSNSLVKWIVGRFRPYKVPSAEGLHPFHFRPFCGGFRGLFNQHDLCFPSGHACTAFALATAMWIVWPRGAWVFIVFATCVGVERVIENAHYTSDVVAAVGLAMVGTGLVYKLLGNGIRPGPNQGAA